MKDRRQHEKYQIVSVRSAGKPSPIIPAEAAYAFPKVPVSVGSLGNQRIDSAEEKRRVIEVVLSGDFEGLLWCGGGGIFPALTAR